MPVSAGDSTDYEGTGPLGDVIVVTPHATDPLSIGVTRSVYIGTAGNLVCRMAEQSTDVTLPLGVGWHPIAVTHIRNTSTATNILAGN